MCTRYLVPLVFFLTLLAGCSGGEHQELVSNTTDISGQPPDVTPEINGTDPTDSTVNDAQTRIILAGTSWEITGVWTRLCEDDWTVDTCQNPINDPAPVSWNGSVLTIEHQTDMELISFNPDFIQTGEIVFSGHFEFVGSNGEYARKYMDGIVYLADKDGTNVTRARKRGDMSFEVYPASAAESTGATPNRWFDARMTADFSSIVEGEWFYQEPTYSGRWSARKNYSGESSYDVMYTATTEATVSDSLQFAFEKPKRSQRFQDIVGASESTLSHSCNQAAVLKETEKTIGLTEPTTYIISAADKNKLNNKDQIKFIEETTTLASFLNLAARTPAQVALAAKDVASFFIKNAAAWGSQLYQKDCDVLEQIDGRRSLNEFIGRNKTFTVDPSISLFENVFGSEYILFDDAFTNLLSGMYYSELTSSVLADINTSIKSGNEGLIHSVLPELEKYMTLSEQRFLAADELFQSIQMAYIERSIQLTPNEFSNLNIVMTRIRSGEYNSEYIRSVYPSIDLTDEEIDRNLDDILSTTLSTNYDLYDAISPFENFSLFAEAMSPSLFLSSANEL